VADGDPLLAHHALGVTVPVTTTGLPLVTVAAAVTAMPYELLTICTTMTLLVNACTAPDLGRTARTFQITALLGALTEKLKTPAAVGFECPSSFHVLPTSRYTVRVAGDPGSTDPVSSTGVRTRKLAAVV
jgi:hypothetical protein